jgi:site-specific recombinase XerD
MPRKTFRKVITSPELIAQINPENKKLMERFLKNCSTKKSPNTVVNYRSNLNIFFCYLIREGINIPFIELKKMDFMDFFDYAILELHWGSERFSNCHSCLSSFSRWIERSFEGEKYEKFRNLLPYIEKPVKELTRKKSVFTQEETDNLMNWLGEEGRIQEQCLLALMLGSGARRNELERFKTSLIDENNLAFDGLFLETTEEMQVKGRGVNGKHIKRYIIKDIFLPYYHKWLPIREQIMKDNGEEHDSIFILKNGKPASATTFKNWLDRWDKYTTKKFNKPTYFHLFRHRWTTYLSGIGVEKELIQELQDWSSDTLVSLYNDSTAKDRKWKGLDKLKIALEQDKQDKQLKQTEETVNNQDNTTENST